jgi:hypothetical protein
VQLKPLALQTGWVPQTLDGSQYPEQQSVLKPQPAPFAVQGSEQTGVARAVLQ